MKNLFTSFLFIACVTSIASAQLPSYIPADGLIAWWGFNGNAEDLSGNGNHGAVNGALLTADRQMDPDKAYAFDGIDDDILIGTTPNFQVPQFTVAGWLNTSSNISNYQTMFSYYTFIPASGEYAGYWLGLLNKRACLFLADGIGMSVDIVGTDTINDGQWHFILATFNNLHEGSIYVDGMLQNTQIYDASIQDATAQIGNSFLSEEYEGALDDIGVWNRVLTQEEILAVSSGCDLSIIAHPQSQHIPSGSDVMLLAFAGGFDVSYQWQTDVGFNYQNVVNINQYSGANTASLRVENVNLSNHLQPFRLIASNENCADTSEIAVLTLTDTCIVTVNDTVVVSVNDTTFITIMDTTYTEVTDTTFITITDTTHVEITDTTFITITDTTHIEITDTTYVSVTDTLIINAMISSIPPGNINTLKVYPNPASTHLTIDNGDFVLMNGYVIRIDNASGVNVFSQEINQQLFQINLSIWTGNGIYFLHLIDPDGKSVDVKKIILQ